MGPVGHRNPLSLKGSSRAENMNIRTRQKNNAKRRQLFADGRFSGLRMAIYGYILAFEIHKIKRTPRAPKEHEQANVR